MKRPGTLRFGFYSYGEISPHAVSGHCELHDQTMTVTAIREAIGQHRGPMTLASP